MRKIQAVLVLAVLMCCGCSDYLSPKRKTIAMNVNTGDVNLEMDYNTKSGFVAADPFTGAPSKDNSLDVCLWYSYDPGKYLHNPQPPQYIPCFTTAKYTSADRVEIKTGESSLLYPIASDSNYGSTNEGKVYCAGFSPAEGWNTSESSETVTTTSHIINGEYDIMFADQMIGSYSDNFPAQTFRHLLTWVKINMSATSIAASKVWGNVESLEIVSPKSNVSISVPGVDDEGKLITSSVSYEGESAEFQVKLPTDKSLSITTKTFGQVFCAPPAANAEGGDGELGYTIRVKTSNMPEKKIFVALKKEDNTTSVGEGDAIGKLFVINLHFNDIAIIEGVCTLKQWDDQSSDIYFQQPSQNQ